MEPAAGDLAANAVDITVAQLQDIGWTHSPTFVTTPPARAEVGQPFEYGISVLVNDDVGDELIFTALTVPPWLSFTTTGPDAALLSGVPAASDAGNHLVSIRVQDEQGNTTLQRFTITVLDTTLGPRFTTSPPILAAVGVTYRYEAAADDPASESEPVISAATLPGWLSHDSPAPGMATLIGTPSASDLGEHLVVLQLLVEVDSPVEQRFTITVEDRTPPLITVHGSTNVSIACGSDYDELGATASDGVDGPLPITTECNIDLHTPGNYTCIYSATDAVGNTSRAFRFIAVVDTTPPIIALRGEHEVIVVEGGDTYVERGAIAQDACAGELPVIIGGDIVNSNEPGVYFVTYNAVDPSGNTALQVVRRVEVVANGNAGCAAGPAISASSGDFVLLLAAVAAMLLARWRGAYEFSRKYVSTRSR